MPTEPIPERRHTGRVPHRARIILSGTDADGFNFAEETETLNVSQHGLSARISYNLALGHELSVRTKDHNRVGQFQVVWVGKPNMPGGGCVGMKWVEPSRFWGIQFAAEDRDQN